MRRDSGCRARDSEAIPDQNDCHIAPDILIRPGPPGTPAKGPPADFSIFYSPPIAALAYGKPDGLLPRQSPHAWFGGAVDFNRSEPLPLGSGPPAKILTVQFQTRFSFNPVELKLKIQGMPKDLNGPADDVELRRTLPGNADD